MEELTLQDRFHQDIVKACNRMKKEAGCNPTHFMKNLSTVGGLQAAKMMIAKNSDAETFSKLWENKKLSLSIEAFVIKSDYRELFTEEEVKICVQRLRDYGYLAS